MLPFDKYPQSGMKLLGQPKDWSNCRHGCGLELMRLTRLYRCAYCDKDLTHEYHTWLLMEVDHVITKKMAKRLGLEKRFYDDFTNLVLSCSGCNHFCNQYDDKTVSTPDAGWTEEAFVQLRDRVFRERFAKVSQRRTEEIAFFEGKPWSST